MKLKIVVRIEFEPDKLGILVGLNEIADFENATFKKSTVPFSKQKILYS